MTIHKCPCITDKCSCTTDKCSCTTDRSIELTSYAVKTKKEKCTFCNVKVTSDLEGSECTKCSKYHCLAHRHPESHECIKLKEEKLQLAFKTKREKRDISSLAPRGLKGAKNDSLANKVAFMKMKQSAKTFTSVPESERVFFRVICSICSLNEAGGSIKSDPNETGGSTKSDINTRKGVFIFSKLWSTGRCVDYLAEYFRVPNKNNLSNTSTRLILSSLCQAGHLELDETIGSAIEKGLIKDGEELILGYSS